MLTAPTLVGQSPSRRSLIDWLSVSRKTESDREIKEIREAVQSICRDHFGYGDTVPMKSAGNFGEGAKFEHLGGEMKWTTRTQADLNDWDPEGRCVGYFNLTLKGSSGIGSLPLEKSFSLITALDDLGISVCRRIDCTLDLYDDWDLDVFLIREHLKEGSWRIPRRNPADYRFIGAVVEDTGKPTPATLYLAARTSDSRVTVYDKGAQLEQERAWLRFELRSVGRHAEDLHGELLKAADSANESCNALIAADTFVTRAVKGAADIRDVTAFPDYPNLPRNWMRSPKATTPKALAPVFQQTAPLDVREVRLAGGLAGQVRHVVKSQGKTIWKLCLIGMASGSDPGPFALEMGFTHFGNVTAEDFVEMSQSSGIPIAKLEQVELEAISAVAKGRGLEVDVISSHRTELRQEVMRKLTGGL